MLKYHKITSLVLHGTVMTPQHPSALTVVISVALHESSFSQGAGSRPRMRALSGTEMGKLWPSHEVRAVTRSNAKATLLKQR